MTDFTLRERVLIKLLVYLIEFIGRKQDGFYSCNLDTCIHEIFFPKLDLKDKEKQKMESRYKTTKIMFLKARDFDEWKVIVEDATNKATIYMDKRDMWELLREIYEEVK